MAGLLLCLHPNYGHLEIVKLLIERGTNINTQNNDGDTALTACMPNGHIEIVKLLIAQQ